MNRGDFRNENKFERARERVPLLPVRSRLGVITADRPFGPTIKQTIDRPFESNYKLVLPFSRLSNTLRSLSSRGQNLPLSLSYFHGVGDPCHATAEPATGIPSFLEQGGRESFAASFRCTPMSISVHAPRTQDDAERERERGREKIGWPIAMG